MIELLLAQLTTEDQQAVVAEKLSAVKGLHPLLKPLVNGAVEKCFADKQLPSGLGGLRLGGKWHVFRLQDVSAGTSASPGSEEQKPKAKKSASAATSRPAAQPAASASTPANPPVAETEATASIPAETNAPHVTAPAIANEPTEVSEPAAPSESVFNQAFAKDLATVFERLSEESRLPGCVSLADLRPALSQYSRETFDAELIRLRKSGLYSLSVVEGRYPLTDAERDACLLIDNSPHLLVRRRAS